MNTDSTADDPANESATAIGVGGGANMSGAPQVAQQNMHFIEETGRWTYTDAEGISYEYDENLKAWFPMFNEQLVQAQQSAYGETVPDSYVIYAENSKRNKSKRKDYDNDNNSTAEQDDNGEEHVAEFLSEIESMHGGKNNRFNKQNNKRQKNNNNPQERERKPKPISSVFVTGLPFDTDVEEVADVFKKGGVFMEDEKGVPKIKLYTDKEGRRTGEGLVSYLRPESVALAIDLLDDTEFRPGVERGRVRVQQAQFKEKEKPEQTKSTLSEDQKKKVQKKYQKLEKKLDWFEDDENLVKAEKWNKVCILKHMFTLQELEADPTLLLDLKEDIREECEKVGEVTNVIIYDHHPEGVVSVRFKDKESAELCVRLMSGRYFAGQKVVAEIYDGHTKYDVKKSKEELEQEEKQRLDRYAKWLESEEEKEKQAKQSAVADAPTP
ncbi:hypothetical protein BCR41DRAFT_299494 [Lobosporangium transversale]|uniref:RRM domain-containing protein n=1 Tax=Lobosporangium transversale TaxID=64571 RepID=A0A1Y2H1F4_9FUNG|nr:hypothetical protein BCR41DRAFT_299494 [Lobosporangium transversale]ORZ27874.1 hypothetical protein BCR41DRAFT_299494 [Lobosporangium transversale]|eukprot:XP_021885577.1 hypothetical protein BCR41DRAFT_299494 [Lobosporangium transversale]